MLRPVRRSRSGFGGRALIALSSWVVLLLVASALFAQSPPREPGKTRPRSPAGLPAARSGKPSAQAPLGSPPARTPGDLREIEGSWMQAIHSDGSAPGASGAVAAPAAGTNPTEGADSGDMQRFADPAGADSARPGATADSGANSSAAGAAGSLFASEEGPSFVSVVFRFLGLTGLMIGVLYLVLRLVRNRTGPLLGGSELVSVIATIPLMQGRFLQIVDLAGQLLVLGVSDSGVNLVAEIDDARVGDRIRLWQAERSRMPLPSGMLEQLTGLLKSADFRFWHHEGRERTIRGPGFREWLGRYAPAAAEDGPADAPAVDDEAEALGALLRSQREKLSTLQNGGEGASPRQRRS